MGFHRSEIALPCQQESSNITYFFTCNLAPKLDCTSTGQMQRKAQRRSLVTACIPCNCQSEGRVWFTRGVRESMISTTASQKQKHREQKWFTWGPKQELWAQPCCPPWAPDTPGQVFCWEFFCFAFSFPRNFLLGTFLFVIQPAGCLSCRQSYFISNFFSLLYFVKTHAKFLSSSRKIQ